ncbi:hypothetical protein HK098_000516 [Nowakowskiella sp. JEL0407]|nr:hypothetical protein HK098_000516 [Nowakowskiella sp. JEL0407]
MFSYSSLITYGLPIGLGIANQSVLRGSVAEIGKFVSQTLPEASLSNHKTGIVGVDRFLISVEDDSIRLLWFPLGSTFLAFFAWAGIEGIREGSTYMNLIYPVTGFFGQLLGVAVAVPTFWVPTFFANLSIESPVSVTSVLLVFAGLTYTCLPLMQLYTLPEPSRTSSIIWFQYSPIVGWLAWAFAPLMGSSVDNMLFSALPWLPRVSPREAAQSAFLFTAGLCFTSHVQMIAELMGKKSLWKRTLSYIFPQTGAKAVGRFLTIDFLGIYTATLGAIYLEGGFENVLKVLCMTPIVGPGAAISLHLATRESLMF